MPREVLTIICGDALAELRKLPAESVQCCVTSPPFFGLRDYGCNGQIGLEKTPAEYVARMVEIFREVRRVLRSDGTLWLNLGDSYAGSGKGQTSNGCADPKNNKTRGMKLPVDHSLGQRIGSVHGDGGHTSGFPAPPCLKPKDLVGIPWMVAFALRADGWYLRQDIIWAKPNPMPESVRDRCTKSHEYIFLLTKEPRYFYDQEAIKQPLREASVARLGQDVENQEGSDRVPGKTNGKMKAVRFGGKKQCPDTRLQSGNEWKPRVRPHGIVRDRMLDYDSKESKLRPNNNRGCYESEHELPEPGMLANKKSVWMVATQGYREAHFATYPPDLIKPCILAGSRAGDIVLDPFAGSGTTGEVALELGRKAILIELNPKYIPLIKQRCDITPGLAL
jgi:DNA modification methylase